MSKVRKNFSLPYAIAQSLDNEVEDGHKSDFVADAIKDKLQLRDKGDDELVERKKAVNEKLEQLKEEKIDVETEITAYEQELSAIESALEKAKEEENLLEEALPILVNHYRKLKRDRVNQDPMKRIHTTERFNMWLEKLDLDSGELKQKIMDEVGE